MVRGLALAAGTAGVLTLGVWANGTTEPQDEVPVPKPTKEHELLKRGVGRWDAVIKSSMPGPDGKPEESESRGVEITRLMPGGLWTITEFRGEFAGMPFHGHGTNGYDPFKKKYVSTWVDSFGPSLMISEGDYDGTTETLTSTADTTDPASGQTIKVKSLVKYEGDDRRVFTMLMQIPGAGDELVKVMEITYTRREGPPGEPKKKKALFKREFGKPKEPGK
jgi:hypothetical protein